MGAADGDAAADAGMAFVCSPQLRSKLRRTPRGATDAGINLWDRGKTILDYPAFTTTSVPANITRGSGTSLSCLLYGNFADLVINLFTVLDVVVNPFLQSVSGIVRVSAFLDIDVMPRHNGSFAKLVGTRPDSRPCEADDSSLRSFEQRKVSCSHQAGTPLAPAVLTGNPSRKHARWWKSSWPNQQTSVAEGKSAVTGPAIGSGSPRSGRRLEGRGNTGLRGQSQRGRIGKTPPGQPREVRTTMGPVELV